MMNAAAQPLPPELAGALERIRKSRFAPFQLHSLLWLALPPAWTESLAKATYFPLEEITLLDFLERAEAAKLCFRDPEPSPEQQSAEAARTLAALWPHLSPPLQASYWPELERHARAMPNREEGLGILASLDTGEKGDKRASQVGQLLSELPDPESRARIFVQTAIDSGDREFMGIAFHATQSIRPLDERAEVRVALCARMGTDAGARATEAFRDAIRVEQLGRRAGLLLRLRGSVFPYPQFDRALEDALKSIEDSSTRAFFISLLAKDRHDPVRANEALRTAANLADSSARARALARIAVNCWPHAGLDALNQAWDSALNVQDSMERTSLLAMIASQWAQVDPQQAIMQTESLTSAECRAEVYLACLGSMAEPSLELSDRVKRTIDEIPLRSLRDRLEIRLATTAPYRNLVWVLDSVRAMPDNAERRAALLYLLPRMSERSRRSSAVQILESLHAVNDSTARRSALTRIAPYLDERRLVVALQLAASPPVDRGFRVDDLARRDIFDYAAKTASALYVYDAACFCGQAIVRAADVAAPAPTLRWAQLASRLREPNPNLIQRFASATGLGDNLAPSMAGPFLTAQIRELVDAGDTGSALAWLDAGQILAMAAGGEVESAVLTGRHRVELTYRRAMDERHLRRYLERREQSKAFEDLLHGPDSHWALHFLGSGGVGKTMLLRHIAARLAVKDGQRLATTRIDFDHISPEFPMRKPGQLLAELADELRIYGGSLRIEEIFNEFQDRLLSLHAQLGAQPPPEDPLRNVRSPEFREVLSGFVSLLSQFPPPVVLILDTCEELAKLEPIEGRLPSVEATFEILEQLHEWLPSVRVVFAGRRLLAQAGDWASGGPCGWRARAGALGERTRYLPAAKDYLRMHVIRGFASDECEDFLARIAGVALTSELRSAILERSAEAAKPVPIQWNPAQPEFDIPRFNPFDVAIYAEWVRESPDVTPELIRSGETEPYLEMRIVRRLENDAMRNALPAAMLLRRFDESMLRAIEPDESSRAALFRDLEGQEWIDAQRDEALDRLFLEVNPNLRLRIENYYSTSPRRLELDQARNQLGPALDSMLREFVGSDRWRSELNFSRLDAALRLLPPERAALLWDLVDKRVTVAGEWSWAYRICPSLLGETNVAGSATSPLRAAIRATLNAALLHLERDFDPRPAWQEVARTLEFHPVPEIAEWLRYRANVFLGEALRAPDFGDGFRGEQAWACALGQTYDRNLSREWLHQVAIPEALDFAAADTASARESLPDDLRFLADFLDGTLNRDDALIDIPEISGFGQRWADWRIPDCLTDRLRLEFALQNTLVTVHAWTVAALRRLDNIDSERLLSYCFQRYEISEPATIEQALAARYYDPARIPVCAAHRATKPLYLELAAALVRLGNRNRAVEMLTQVRSRALEARQPQEAVAELDGFLEQIREPAPLRTQAASPAPSSASRNWPVWLGCSVGAVLFIGILVGVIYETARWSMKSATHLVYLGCGLCIVLIWALRRRLIRWFQQKKSNLLRPRLSFSTSGVQIVAAGRQNQRRGPRWLPWPLNFRRREFREIFTEQFQPPSSGAYREQSSTVASLAQHVKGKRILGVSMPIELECERELRGIPWEALLQHAIDPRKEPVRESVQFWRIGPAPEPHVNVTRWKAGRRVCLLSRSRDRHVLERIWFRQFGAEISAFDERTLGASRTLDIPEGLRVLHLVGRTRRSSGEKLFQLTPECYFDKYFFRPGTVPQIAIVQAQPVESLERTDTDRELMAEIRSFAADMFKEGVRTVIFLPQMPIAVAEKALTKLVAFCRERREPSRFALLNLVSDVRKIIGDAAARAPAGDNEAARKYSVSEEAPGRRAETVDAAVLKRTAGEMAMDVTIWTR